MGFSELLNSIGGLGTFQKVQTALLLLPWALLSSQNLLQNFTAAEPDHRCRLPPPDNRSGSGDLTGPVGARDLLRASVPLDAQGRPDRCLRYPRPQWQLLLPNASAEGLVTEGCLQGWVYDRTVFLSTIVTEWDLVCGKESMKSIAQSVYMAGLQVGAVVFGTLSDRFGRKTIMTWSALQMSLTGVCAAFVPTYASYCALRFLSGMALTGVCLTSHCLNVEWTPTQSHTLVNTVTAYYFTVGQLILPGAAYLIRDWRWLQFTLSVLFIVVFFYSRWWYLLSASWEQSTVRSTWESPSLQRVARINGRAEEGEKITLEVRERERLCKELDAMNSSPFISDLFHTPTMRMVTCCIMLLWFVCSFAYYGLAMDLEKFGLNVYWIQVLFAAVDVPGKLAAALGIFWFSRRFTLLIFQLLAGSMIIGSIFIPPGMSILQSILALMGKGFLASAFTCLYQYTLELFPTEIRQMGMGAGFFSSRMGSLMAPFIYVVGSHVPILQPVLFGAAPLLSVFAVCFLFDTRNLPLPETVQEVEGRWVFPTLTVKITIMMIVRHLLRARHCIKQNHIYYVPSTAPNAWESTTRRSR
uniref:Major facilitator superfamily (MFS) profile domain-containing protein n=1 Tax=Ornithorhynchus anatinus TaxID=9258 RepID=A0A6I8NAZ5_ORNAN